MTEKILSFDALAKKAHRLKKTGKRIVLCHGVFDLMHPGHILYFQAAKREGDILVVTLTPDHFVNKGPGRPVYNQRLRLESIAALECVDFVALNHWPTAVKTILKLKPDVYAKGQDYANAASDVTGQIKNEMAAVQSVGGNTIFTHEQMFSSSNLINRFFSAFPTATQEYIARFRKRHPADTVLGHLKNLSGLRVLVIGEAILDQYYYCQPLGKSPKETIVASKFISEENFAGGSLAIANHVAGLCGSVTLFAGVGREAPYQKFFKNKLSTNVRFLPLDYEDRPTIVKRRYVEPNFLTKMFEIQYLNDTPLPPHVERKAIALLRKQFSSHDLVIVADYGHGLLTDRLRAEISGKAKFLCINTQTNSANLGFNPATRYKNVQFAALDEPELRFALRTKYGEINAMAGELRRQMKARTLLISRGPNGSVILTPKGNHQTPVMSSRVIDRTGAGDALFALTAPCVFNNVPAEVVGFIGNCAGALAVETVCNREPINPITLSKFITAVLR